MPPGIDECRLSESFKFLLQLANIALPGFRVIVDDDRRLTYRCASLLPDLIFMPAGESDDCLDAHSCEMCKVVDGGRLPGRARRVDLVGGVIGVAGGSNLAVVGDQIF